MIASRYLNLINKSLNHHRLNYSSIRSCLAFFSLHCLSSFIAFVKCRSIHLWLFLHQNYFLTLFWWLFLIKLSLDLLIIWQSTFLNQRWIKQISNLIHNFHNRILIFINRNREIEQKWLWWRKCDWQTKNTSSWASQ